MGIGIMPLILSILLQKTKTNLSNGLGNYFMVITNNPQSECTSLKPMILEKGKT